MFQLFLIILAIIAIAVLLLGIRVLLGRKFVNMHIEGNKALNRKGIHCVQSMDRNMRKDNPNRVSERRHPIKCDADDQVDINEVNS
jgi:hypothetical protein